MANLEFSNEFANQFVSEYGIEDMAEIDLYDVAYFIDENWKDITGFSDKEIEEVPEEVSEILEQFDVDPDDFLEAWEDINGEMEEFDYEEDEEEGFDYEDEEDED